MEEQIVSFETAKLAKEKGFDIPVRYGVFGKKMKLTENHGWEWNKKLELRNWNTPNANSYSVPTQSLLQKWLREVHNVQLTIIPVGNVDFSLKYWHYSILGLNCNEGKNDVNRFFTYEQTLEEGLKEALKLV